jgi:hypothetical protein
MSSHPAAAVRSATPGTRPAARLRHRALSIAEREVNFDVRGFHTSGTDARIALERHGASFVAGFNAGLLATDTDDLALRLLDICADDRGFAYEGSAMALGVLDIMTPVGGNRLERLLGSEQGQPHVYMVHVGAGWSLARLHLRPRSHLRALDPFLRWLTVDGYGFHHGFFAPTLYIHGRASPRRLHGYERRAFDQGLGRSMWFVVGADPELAAQTVGTFDRQRRDDLWSGLGLAAAYTTAASHAALTALRDLSGQHAPALAQGAAFAVAARHRAQNVLAHTHAAAELLCGQPVEDIVVLVASARVGLQADARGGEYERWRIRIAERLAGVRAAVR